MLLVLFSFYWPALLSHSKRKPRVPHKRHGVEKQHTPVQRHQIEIDDLHVCVCVRARALVCAIGSNKFKRIVFQAADVHKPLLSISGCADLGFDGYLGDDGGHLRGKQTGVKIPLTR